MPRPSQGKSHDDERLFPPDVPAGELSGTNGFFSEPPPVAVDPPVAPSWSPADPLPAQPRPGKFINEPPPMVTSQPTALRGPAAGGGLSAVGGSMPPRGPGEAQHPSGTPPWPTPGGPRPPLGPLRQGVGHWATRRQLAIIGSVAVAVSVLAIYAIHVWTSNPTSSSVATSEHWSTASSSSPNGPAGSGSDQVMFTPNGGPPPPEVPGPDGTGAVCNGGFHLDHTGWATKGVRGSQETSCLFVSNVLKAYWQSNPRPSLAPIAINVSGAVSCRTVQQQTANVSCAGDQFVMACGGSPGDTWITCTGGHNARVFLW